MVEPAGAVRLPFAGTVLCRVIPKAEMSSWRLGYIVGAARACMMLLMEVCMFAVAQSGHAAPQVNYVVVALLKMVSASRVRLAGGLAIRGLGMASNYTYT